MSFQEKDLQAGFNLNSLSDAQNYLTKGGQTLLTTISENEIVGSATKPNGSGVYSFHIDLVTPDNTSCACGYYLPYKRNDHKSLCSHTIAALISADNGAVTVQVDATASKRGRKPKASDADQDDDQKVSIPGQYSFKSKTNRAISSAIVKVKDLIIECLNKDKHPFLVGPTGCGKTSAVESITDDNSFWFNFFKRRDGRELDQFKPNGIGMYYQTVAGMESFGDADLMGLITPGGKIKGVIPRAFELAREGKIVTIFVDEFKRFDRRVQNILMLALLPKSAKKALQMSIDSQGEDIYYCEAPIWGYEWAPVKNIIWIFGSNSWGSELDSAFVRRIQSVKIGYYADAIKHLDLDMQTFIQTTWLMTEQGSLPLPVEYGMISKMRGPKDVTMFADYLENVGLIDPALQQTIAQLVPEYGRKSASQPDELN